MENEWLHNTEMERHDLSEAEEPAPTYSGAVLEAPRPPKGNVGNQNVSMEELANTVCELKHELEKVRKVSGWNQISYNEKVNYNSFHAENAKRASLPAAFEEFKRETRVTSTIGFLLLLGFVMVAILLPGWEGGAGTSTTESSSNAYPSNYNSQELKEIHNAIYVLGKGIKVLNENMTTYEKHIENFVNNTVSSRQEQLRTELLAVFEGDLYAQMCGNFTQSLNAQAEFIVKMNDNLLQYIDAFERKVANISSGLAKLNETIVVAESSGRAGRS
eukprot:m.24806 g.24806  ORF g.24806 m.24806 type:complete len:274 (-) comp7646_c0_seq1:95-916(-)